ncbi:MAG: alpha/beta fold hydrolase [Pleurocapsa sp. SU_196_0]|nr:alpha/beta fold hydrolase [Pleurocapsa sp. SU_196_0]
MPERISYTVAGKGKPVVLVHGLAGSRRWWRHQIPWLEQQAQVWTLELPGFGASARHRPLSITEAADVLSEFLHHHDLERPVFVGHSMGAHIGLHGRVTRGTARTGARVRQRPRQQPPPAAHARVATTRAGR